MGLGEARQSAGQEELTTLLGTAINSSSIGSKSGPGQRMPTAKFLRLLTTVFFAILGGVIFGFEISVFSGAKLIIVNEDVFAHAMSSTYRVGAVTSGVVIGAFAGAYLAGALHERVGRKWSMVLSSSLYMLGVATTFISLSYATLITGRMITGAAVGMFSTTVPLYIAELSPKHIRGSLVTANQLFICVGILIGFVVDTAFKCPDNGAYCEIHHIASWRWMLISATPIAAVVILAFGVFLPPSPRYLVKKGRVSEARRVLHSLRPAAAVEDEISDIMAATTQAQASWGDLKAPNVVYGLYIGAVLSAVQQFTGTNAVNFYAQNVLLDAGFTQDEAYMFSIHIGVIKVVFVAVGILLIDRLGRRPLMIWGVLGMTISTLVLAAIFQVRQDVGSVTRAEGWVALVSLLLFMAFYEVSMGPAVWLYLSEIFPLKVRGKAMAVSAAINWLFTFVIGFSFPIIVDAWYPGGMFFIFGGFCVVSLVWIVRVLPETKGKSLEQIEQEFIDLAGGSAPR